jgi:LCP family protein required for cell wall assembly
MVAATAAASALIMTTAVALAAFLGHLNGNIATDPMSVLGPLPPPSRAGVLTILALGSQTRDGQGPGFGHDRGTDLSDTAMLIHLNAAHTTAIVVSIPRDLLVYRPPCRERVGGSAIVAGARLAMFDSAMNLGGPACAVAVAQDMSGIRIDHFIRIDFTGFRTMTSVLGGVEVCVPPPGIHDWRSRLNISPGRHVISGDEALAFVRDRHGIGNGGDLGRIRMQQMFVSSLIRKIMSNGTLTDPVALYRVADAATRSVTTDPGLGSVQALLSLAESLRSLKLSAITFVTLPNEIDPANVNRLMPAEPAARHLWQLLRADHPWTLYPERLRPPPAHHPSSAAPVPVARPAAARPRAAVEARAASENICDGLPAPNNLGELGR